MNQLDDQNEVERLLFDQLYKAQDSEELTNLKFQKLDDGMFKIGLHAPFVTHFFIASESGQIDDMKNTADTNDGDSISTPMQSTF